MSPKPCVIGQDRGGDAAAVDQDQRGVRAQAAQRDAGRGAAGEAAAVGERNGALAVGGQRLQVLADGGLAGLVDFVLGDHLDRRSGLGVGSTNRAARDLHALQRLLSKHRLGRHHRRGPADRDQGRVGNHGPSEVSFLGIHELSCCSFQAALRFWHKTPSGVGTKRPV
jgi:hypothetical protein